MSKHNPALNIAPLMITIQPDDEKSGDPAVEPSFAAMVQEQYDDKNNQLNETDNLMLSPSQNGRMVNAYDFDEQGIKIIQISVSADDMADSGATKTPETNLKEKNVEWVIYRKGVKQQFPPIRYVALKKVNALVDAINHIPDLNGMKLHTQKGPDIRNKIEESTRKFLHDWKKTLQADPEDLREKEKKEFIKAAQEHLKWVSAYCMEALWQDYETAQKNSIKQNEQFKKISKKEFCKELIKVSENRAANPNDVITVDQNTGKFSYTKGSPVVAHDEGLYSGLRNPRVVIEGRINPGENDKKAENDEKNENKTVPIKPIETGRHCTHGSLAPLGAFKKRSVGKYMGSLFKALAGHSNQDQEILRDTLNNGLTLAKNLAQEELQRRERESKPEEKQQKAEATGTKDHPFKLRFNYQMLTTNAFDKDFQAESYGYTAEAMDLLNGVIFKQDGKYFKVECGVFNVGINVWAKIANAIHWRSNKGDTERMSNEQAFFKTMLAGKEQRGEFVPKSPILDFAERNNGESNKNNKNQKREETLKELYHLFHEKLKEIEQFNQDFTMSFINRDEATGKIKAQTKAPYDTSDTIKQKRAGLRAKKQELSMITAKMKKLEKKEFKNLEQLDWHKDFAKKQPEEKKQNQIKILEFYLKELYLSGKYRNPKNAILFHAYLALYNQLVGVHADFGCKSGNDRTYTVRVLVDRLMEMNAEGQAIPPIHRLGDRDLLAFVEGDWARLDGKKWPSAKNKGWFDIDLNLFVWQIEKDQVKPLACWTNSGVHASIQDTGGGPPKSGSFQFILGRGVKWLDPFEKFANHLMTKILPSVLKIDLNKNSIVQSFKKRLK